MTLLLTVDQEAWRAHVEHVVTAYAANSPVVPVVKGNGYGFGRSVLARVAGDLLASRQGAGWSPTIAVGTVHELAGLPTRLRPVVLTPPGAVRAQDGTAGRRAVGERRGVVERLHGAATAPLVTVGDRAHVAAIDGWRGEVLVKLASSMRRFGVSPRELDDMARHVRGAGLTVAGYSIHLPLAGEEADLVAEVERWLTALTRHTVSPTAVRALWVSHLGPDAHAGLCIRWPEWHFPIRLGTTLWHGDKATLQLGADVLDVHHVAAGTTAGYHATRVIADGSVVVIGAGTTHGVIPLDDGRSPFHFQRRRLALLERPHMHTSMVFIPSGQPCPEAGDVVDVQRPLTAVAADELVWRQ